VLIPVYWLKSILVCLISISWAWLQLDEDIRLLHTIIRSHVWGQTFDAIFKQGVKRIHYQIDVLDSNKAHIHVVIWPTFFWFWVIWTAVAYQIAAFGFSVTADWTYTAKTRTLWRLDEKRATNGGVCCRSRALCNAAATSAHTSPCLRWHARLKPSFMWVSVSGRLGVRSWIAFEGSARCGDFQWVDELLSRQSEEKPIPRPN